MIIEVTAAYIKLGKPRNLFADPISLAIKQALGAKWVMTGWGYATVEYWDGRRQQYDVGDTGTVAGFLARFDVGRAVDPCNVTIHLISETAPRRFTNNKPRQHQPASGEIRGASS